MESEYLYAKWQAISLPCPVEEASALFADLEKRYSERGRHYHNFDHLAAMFRLFDAVQPALQYPDIVALAIFFHDAVYNVSRKDNEEKSAVLTGKKLPETGYPDEKTKLVKVFILATRDHALPENAPPDLAFFLDFDLAVLGGEWEAYETYAQNIRREYRIYPDLLYRPGRRKALEHFLERPFIFHTEVFREKYEQRTRENVRREIALLSV